MSKRPKNPEPQTPDDMIYNESEFGLDKFGPYNSRHEAWAVLYEEVMEAFDALRANDEKQFFREMIQVAAVARRACFEFEED